MSVYRTIGPLVGLSAGVDITSHFYALNFEKVGRAYCFRLVCLSVCLSVCVCVCTSVNF